MNPTLPSADHQRKWIQIAESLKPSLLHTRRDPVSLVQVLSDASAFQGWRVKQTTDLPSLASRQFAAGDTVILDFGQHCVGSFHLELSRHGSGDSPTRLRLTFAEVPAEVAEPLDPYKGSLSRAWLQDEVINIDVVPARVDLPRRYAFRYVKIEIIATSGAFKVSVSKTWCDGVSSAPALESLPQPKNLSEDLRTIDRISLHTLRDCMQTVFEDGPKRDRRLWLGDLRLQALANAVSFKNFELVKRCLYLHAGLLREDGLVPACVYETPSPRIGANFIVDYAALFAPTLLEYAEASGDLDTARELWPVALWQTELLKCFVDDAGRFTNPEKMWVFIDWNAKLHRDAAALGALIFGLGKTIALAERIGMGGSVSPLRDRLKQWRAAATRDLFDRERGLFISGPERQVSWASQAWLILAGVVEGPAAAGALKAVAADASAVKPGSPYGWHYVLEAMFLCDMKSQATEIIRDYWGKMVHLGADTFWEVFDPSDQRLSPYGTHLMNSYCHAWSCTPAVFLRETK